MNLIGCFSYDKKLSALKKFAKKGSYDYAVTEHLINSLRKGYTSKPDKLRAHSPIIEDLNSHSFRSLL